MRDRPTVESVGRSQETDNPQFPRRVQEDSHEKTHTAGHCSLGGDRRSDSARSANTRQGTSTGGLHEYQPDQRPDRLWIRWMRDTDPGRLWNTHSDPELPAVRSQAHSTNHPVDSDAGLRIPNHGSVSWRDMPVRCDLKFHRASVRQSGLQS